MKGLHLYRSLNGRVQISLSSDLDSVSKTVQLGIALLTEFGLAEDDLNGIQLCLTEALNNSVIHAYRSVPGNVIKLNLSFSNKEIQEISLKISLLYLYDC